jgi:hypothetical protein
MRSEAKLPAGSSGRQLPLPLDPPLRPTAPLARAAVTIPAPRVWPHLSAAAQTNVRETFRRILQEVVDDTA